MLTLALLVTAVASMLAVGEAGTAFPGENGKIAFFRQGDIYTIDPDGSDEVNLTGEASGGAPSWSPDGQRIVYESIVDGNFDIYVMNADGSDQTRLTVGPEFDSRPAWSADGSQILFQSTRDGNFEVYIMNANGSDQTRLTDSVTFDGMPAASPDGSTIAFTSDRDGNEELYVMDVDGSRPGQPHQQPRGQHRSQLVAGREPDRLHHRGCRDRRHLRDGRRRLRPDQPHQQPGSERDSPACPRTGHRSPSWLPSRVGSASS